MNNQFNQFLQSVMFAQKQGQNPQQFLQSLMQNNPNMQQNMTRLKNMAQGRSPQEFLTQLAKQQGATPQNIQAIMQILGNK